MEWEPDPDNVYLTSRGLDNLALHRAPAGRSAGAGQTLDHFGVVVPGPKDVDQWHEHIRARGIAIEKELKTHRDGARSFYFRDPDGIVIQVIFHPPIAAALRARKKPGKSRRPAVRPRKSSPRKKPSRRR